MFDNPFTVELVTPERVIFHGDVRVVTAPGSEGGLQILRNHAPLLTGLDTGRLKLRDTEDTVVNFATSGGFLEVRSNLVTILAETAERADQIDVERARRSKERAEERLRSRHMDIDFDRARASLARAINRLNVAQSN